jgi:ribonucleoside-diphosphate reductase alpha chain
MNKLLEYFKGDELAANVIKSKYLQEDEDHPDLLHRRMAKEFYRADKKYQDGYIDDEGIEREGESYHEYLYINDLSDYGRSRNDLTEDSIFEMFKDFKYIIPQGSIMYGLGRKDVFVSLSNCFFVGSPPDDSYNSIMYKDEQLVQLMKRRAGVGIDISSLRPRGASVTNSASTSTGAASFMERYSNTTREVGQQNRRGALLESIDVRHPDVAEFVTMKDDLKKVTGANVSVKLNDDFMIAVENDADYILRFPCEEILLDGYEPEEYNVLQKVPMENIYFKKIRAKELWDLIIKQATKNS